MTGDDVAQRDIDFVAHPTAETLAGVYGVHERRRKPCGSNIGSQGVDGRDADVA